MTYAKKPIPPSPMTEEEKEQRIIRMIAQKRESFATGILFNLCQNPKFKTIVENPDDLVALSVSMADKLIKELFYQAEENEEAEE